MPKIIRELTIIEIKAVKPGETKQDGKGLMLVLDDNGNKRWALRYTRPDGWRNMIGLGSYSNITLIAARTKATHIREKLQQGIDPVEDKKHEKQKQKIALRSTFKALAEDGIFIKKRAGQVRQRVKQGKY